MEAASPHTIQTFTPSTLLPTRWSVSVSTTLTTLSFQANLQKDIADIERERETVWEVFPELSENIIREPATIPPSSSSTSHTNISSTTCHTIPPIACTTNSHTQPHTNDHLHHTKTTTSTTTSVTTLTPIVFPKQPRLKNTKSTHTTSTVSPTTTSTTTSITKSAPTIFPTKSLSKRTKQSTQITIPKRHEPTISPFISTDIRLKRHKKSPSHSNTTGLGSQHTPPPVPLPPPPPQKTYPT